MLFQPFKPMEPVSHPAPFTDSNYTYQVKWDGVRIVAHIGKGALLLHNRKLRERTHHYPELHCLTALLEGEAVLDGEIVALKKGKPHFPLVLERDLLSGVTGPSGQKRVLAAVARVPVTYMIFDLLYHNGESLHHFPLTERQARLRAILRQNHLVQLVEDFNDGCSLYAAVAEKEMEGIVAKKKESFYYAGKKHNSWLKIKVRQKQLAVIGGYTVKEGRINALLLGAYHHGRLVYLGRAATGLTTRHIKELTPFFQGLKRTTPPFYGETAGAEKYWVEPRLVVLVDFQEWTDDMRMRQPVLKGFTEDKPEECVIE
jgi:bifunctional non-homologous end joining protein LigD